jgi:transcriptional regulator with XRE-family HTH domain
MVASMFTAAFEEVVRAVADMRQKAGGMTQRQLAEAVGREQNYVARIETGQRRLDLVELVQLCGACNVDPEREIARITHRIASMVPKRRPAPSRRS